MKTLTKNEVQERIDAARLLLKPSPVRLHHMPRWFVTALKPIREERRRGRLGSYVQDDLLAFVGSGEHWLDHWGSTKAPVRRLGREGELREYFVSEPYGFTAETAAGLNRLAEATGLVWSIESNSWWYPGATVRIVFEKPEAK